MPVEMKTSKLPSEEDRPEVRHAREIDNLKMQCDRCKLKKPNTPSKDCAIRIKLIVNDSKVGWKNKHLFFNQPGNHCKMFKEA